MLSGGRRFTVPLGAMLPCCVLRAHGCVAQACGADMLHGYAVPLWCSARLCCRLHCALRRIVARHPPVRGACRALRRTVAQIATVRLPLGHTGRCLPETPGPGGSSRRDRAIVPGARSRLSPLTGVPNLSHEPVGPTQGWHRRAAYDLDRSSPGAAT
jgi:hypothetical protein